PTLPEEIEGFYYIETRTIYLRQWRNWNIPGWQQDPDWNDDAAVLTRCLPQAWHHAWQCWWDHFASMGCAAWIAIHNWLGDRGYELGFNDLYHDDQRVDRPYYKCLDNYNTEELSSRLNNWAHHENSTIDPRIRYWRYGAAGFCWWKVYRKQFGFMWCFNQKFYDWLVATGFLDPPSLYGDYLKFAVDAYTGGPIEGRDFLEWFYRQPILRNDGWCDDFCALAVDRTKARVLAYRKFVDYTGEEKEVAHSYVGVTVEKEDWQGNTLRYTGVDTNVGGYAEWDFAIDNPDEGIQVKARLNLGAGDITDSRWAIDSDAAYEVDAL
ncbi:MAG: hypothetical protein GTN49_07890, partial [candidate division Zixibacteria bacterium]|nr:hypothetical protein [candidate division Zixibacteria bacterium]